MFDDIPTILTPAELLDKALGRASKIRKEDREAFYRLRKTTLARVESASDILVETLEGYVRRFPSLDKLNTYERELVDLVIGLRSLQRALSRVDGSAETLRALGREAAGDVRRSPARDAMLAAKRHFVGRASSVVKHLEEPLKFLAHAREILGRIPEVTPGDPTIVIAGYPNVGKSSLLARLSRARPDIAPYPFTTKQANVGHFTWPEGDRLHGRRYQLVDTPGLLEKRAIDRNAIERQAVLALKYLADVIVFVLDPSEACGYPLKDQERLLEEVRREFRNAPLLIVENKADLSTRASPHPRVSCTTGAGLVELRKALVDSVPSDKYAEGYFVDEAAPGQEKLS